MRFSSVVSLHTNTFGCGVARFSEQLAQRLGVPFVGFDGQRGNFPLFSVKWSEITDFPADLFMAPYCVFWHDAGYQAITNNASVVFYADPSLGSPGLWCPSLLTPSKPRTVRLFSFGMAHKLQPQHYAKVRQLLDAAGLDYRLRVSVGLHEGTSLSDATQYFDALKDIMGADKVMILGCLSDDAVSEELQRADTVLAFFENGVRANNTTVHAALEASCPVLTNHDQRTPLLLKHRTGNILEIEHWNGTRVLGAAYSWDNLIAEMESIYAATVDRQPLNQR